jgi:lipoprotein-releasing system permease protein
MKLSQNPFQSLLEAPIFVEIGLRYVRARRKSQVDRKDGFLSFIATLSMVGIALGVAALIVVLSVMNGFQKEVRDKMLSVLSHVEIRSQDGIADIAGLTSSFDAATPYQRSCSFATNTGITDSCRCDARC